MALMNKNGGFLEYLFIASSQVLEFIFSTEEVDYGRTGKTGIRIVTGGYSRGSGDRRDTACPRQAAYDVSWQNEHRVANGIGFGNHTAYRSIVVPFWCNQYDFSDPVELAYRTGPQENILPTPAGPVIKTL